MPRTRYQNSAPLFSGDGPDHGMGLDSDEHNQVSSIAGKVKRSENVPVLLPQKCEMLCEVFNAMVNSIRVLRLKQWPATLAQLSRIIESLTDRSFTLHDLARLKLIMPEVIVVKKILVTDEVTSCMKEELLISLEVNAVEYDENTEGGGRFSNLKRLFRTRITEYAEIHPEVDDVSEGELPFLFYKPKQKPEPVYKPKQEPEPVYKPKRKGEPWPFSMNENGTPVLRSATHISPTFKSSFSSRTFSTAAFDSSPAKPSACLLKTAVKEATSALFEDVSVCSAIDTDATPLKVGSNPAEISSTPADCAATPAKFVSTPAELVSTPDRLMAATPSLPTPKRALITDDSAKKVNKSAKRRVIFEESSNDSNEQLNPVGADETAK